MRYVVFDAGSDARVGIVVGSDIVDVSPGLPSPSMSLRQVIASGSQLHSELKRLADDPSASRHPLASCRLRAPISETNKVVCLGLNYADHAKEGGHSIPDYPALFLRGNSSLIGPGQPMVVPTCSERLDYEAELAIVIGRRCRHVPEDAALDVIFGYTAFNDGSVRDYQRRTSQWTAGKNFDGTGALGPWIVTADELPPGASGLGIRSRLNGQIMQDANTNMMLFTVPRTIAILSEFMTLEPGDIIATGTPEGVGHARKPPVWLRPGDEISIEIDGIGVLTNPVEAEPASAPFAAA